MSRDNVILLIGAGGHARSCIDVIESTHYKVAGAIGRPTDWHTLFDYMILGTDGDLPQLLATGDYPNALIAIGHIKSPDARIRQYDFLKDKMRFPVVVSHRAHASRYAAIGDGTIVMHGAVVNAAAKVGVNCIINTNAIVEHDAVVGDHCHISTGAKVNGGVTVGDGTFIGSGVTIREGVKIGPRCVIGMGQSVLKDCPAGTWMPKAHVRELVAA